MTVIHRYAQMQTKQTNQGDCTGQQAAALTLESLPTCEIDGCTRTFNTTRGLSVHQQHTHKEWYNRSQLTRKPPTKVRWTDEELHIIASAEAESSIAVTKTDWRKLSALTTRTEEAIKSQRRSAKYKAILQLNRIRQELQDTLPTNQYQRRESTPIQTPPKADTHEQAGQPEQETAHRPVTDHPTEVNSSLNEHTESYNTRNEIINKIRTILKQQKEINIHLRLLYVTSLNKKGYLLRGFLAATLQNSSLTRTRGSHRLTGRDTSLGESARKR